MKTLIVLAAGQGTRLRPLTDSIPKCLVEIDGESLLKRLLVHFNNWADRIVLVSGYCSHKLDEYVTNNSFDVPVSIIRNDEFAETNSLYSAWLTREYWNKSDEIIFTNSDVIFKKGALSKLFKSTHPIVLSVDIKDCDQEDMRVNIDGSSDKVTRVSKEIPLVQSHGEFTGVSKLTKDGLSSFEEMVREMLNDESMKKGGWYDLVFDNIAQKKQFLHYVSLPSNSYYEIDTLQDLDDARGAF